jgi:hypothetical protein
LKENEGVFFLSGDDKRETRNPIHLVDLPGHLRLRTRINHFLPITRAVVFLIDAVDFLKQKQLIAEYDSPFLSYSLLLLVLLLLFLVVSHRFLSFTFCSKGISMSFSSTK